MSRAASWKDTPRSAARTGNMGSIERSASELAKPAIHSTTTRFMVATVYAPKAPLSSAGAVLLGRPAAIDAERGAADLVRRTRAEERRHAAELVGCHEIL